MSDAFPERIVCLTDETVETLYLLEEDRRIVGISGFCTRPPRARKEKPIVTAFTKARIDDIVALRPDLVIGFSDVQAEIAKQLVAVGVEVHIFNQRTVAGVLRMIRTLGALVGCPDRADELATQLADSLEDVRAANADGPRPRVYFEEWDEPNITAIGYVSELIAAAGGDDVFAELSTEPLAKNRILADPDEVIRRDPDIFLASWCGKPFKRDRLDARPGWDAIRAVQTCEVYEIPSPIILQPGPASLTDGVARMAEIFAAWRAK